jgi:hypothetical protein
MLHTGILPQHTKWMRLFEKLRYVVLDEVVEKSSLALGPAWVLSRGQSSRGKIHSRDRSRLQTL